MGLFQERPVLGDTAMLYTTGMEKTFLIIGLGNIGAEYDGTRHNVGFEVLDLFAAKNGFPGWTSKKDLNCAETNMRIGSARIFLCKPTTFMNDSGRALKAMQHYYKIANSSTLAVYDEAAIDFGQIRTRVGGSSAGHNGVKSLIQYCGEDFGRVRIGIGPKKPAKMELSDFVLAKFSTKEQKDLQMLLKEAMSVLSEYAYGNGELLEDTRNFIV